MKPLIIYHANCADGFGAAFAAWLKLGDEAEYRPMSYGEDAANFSERTTPLIGREIYILDFSFPRHVMDWLFAEASRVIWLDHHKTAFEMWGIDMSKGEFSDHNCAGGRNDLTRLSPDKSGAMLAWEYFHPDFDVPLFIKHIDDYDRWQFKVEGTKVFNKALWSYAPWTFEQWRDWFYDVEDGFGHTYWSDFYHEGEAILRAHGHNVQSVLKATMRACHIEVIARRPGLSAPWMPGREQRSNDADYEVHGLSANCPSHLTSDVGHELATQSGTFGLCWDLGKDGTVANCSLRSNGDYDVSAIAKSFGGGGHRNAAGFQVDIQVLLGWLK